MTKLLAISAIASLVIAPRIIDAKMGDVVKVRQLKIQCHIVENSMHCFQTSKFPRLDWYLYKDQLTVYKTPEANGQAETLYTATLP